MESREIRNFQTKPFFNVDEASSFVLDDNAPSGGGWTIAEGRKTKRSH
jgi:hypothetical protein